MYQEAVCVITCYRDRTEADFQLGQMELPTLPQKDAYRIRLAYGTVLLWHLIGIFMCLTLSQEQNPSSTEIIKLTVSPWHTIQNQLTGI